MADKIRDVRWKHPFTCVVAGPTGCGKTEFVARLIRHVEVTVLPPPQRIVWSYGEWQPAYEDLKDGVEFVEGRMEVPDHVYGPTLFVVDDQMSETDARLTRLFTRGSHHRNISVVYVVQNLFAKNKEHRTISLNAHYLVLFKNPRDASQIDTLGRQMYPGDARFFREAYEDATKRPYGYLLIDLKQDQHDDVRLRTGLFPGEPCYVYAKR
jgi:hypothetical protein